MYGSVLRIVGQAQRNPSCLSGQQLRTFHQSKSMMFPQTLVEKIVQKYASDILPNHEVRAGDYISISPYRVMTHDNTSAVMKKFVGFFSKGTSPKFFNPKQAGKIFSNFIQFSIQFLLWTTTSKTKLPITQRSTSK